MSVWMGGSCKKFIEDDEFIIYEYYPFNIRESFFNIKQNFYGFITIRKNSLIDPPSYESTPRKKIKNLSNWNRKHLESFVESFDIDDLIKSGDVQIENCSRVYKVLQSGEDYIACELCFGIFMYYFIEGKLPEIYEAGF